MRRFFSQLASLSAKADSFFFGFFVGLFVMAFVISWWGMGLPLCCLF